MSPNTEPPALAGAAPRALGTSVELAVPRAPRLRDEVRRKALHMLPGLVPFILSPIPHRDPISPTALGVVFGVTAVLTAAVLLAGPRIGRIGERDWLLRVWSYPIAVVGVLLVFPNRAEFAAVVVVVLAFGDGSATLGGIRWGRRVLPWNAGKTWAGTGCFAAFAAPPACLAFWVEAQPAVPAWEALTCGVVATLAGAAAESLPTRVNDNLRVGLAAACGVALAKAALPG